MSLLRYMQPRSSLPTPQQTGIGERPTTEENAAVAKVIVTRATPTAGRESATPPSLTKIGQRLGGMLQRTAT